MTEKPNPVILAERSDWAALDFLTEKFDLHGTECAVETHLHYTRLLPSKEAEPSFVVGTVAELIVTIYKFRALESLISEYQSQGFEIYALLGALLQVDCDEEIKRIEKLTGYPMEIAPRSLFEFRLKELKEDWEELKALAALLLKQCSSPEDVYRLIPYFINPEDGRSIELGKGPEAFRPERVVIPRYTSDKDADAVIEVVRLRPARVVIKDPESMDERLLNALRALGE